MSVGIRIVHDTERSTVLVVPVLSKPFADGGYLCPGCHILHPVKAVHLWLDDKGEALVSQGVLAELQLAGMPSLTVVGSVDDPPALKVGRGVDRAEVDQANRKIVQYVSV